MWKRTLLFCGALLALFCALGAGQDRHTQEQPQLHEEVTVRWWLVPVYAIDKAGAPVLDLTPDDIELYIKNIRVEKFDIHRKQFQVTETKNIAAPAPKLQPPPQKKLVLSSFRRRLLDP